MNFTRLVLSAILFCALSACKYNVMILKSSGEIAKEWSRENSVWCMRRLIRNDSISIKDRNKLKRIVACDSVWGIKYKDGTVFRKYDEGYFQLRENALVQIYSQIHSSYRTSSTSYYFSKNIDGPIYALKWKNIKKEFQNDTCFLEKLKNNLKWYQDYSSYNTEKGSYLINVFLKSCAKN